MANSLLSGGIGIPEGAFKLLGNREVERAIGFIVQNITNLEQVINVVQGGVGGTIWARFQADGTKITGSSSIATLTGTRTSTGIYPITSTQTAGSSGGNYLFGVNVSVSSKAGNGGDGVSPFLGFSSDDAVLTDQNAGYSNFWYSSVTGKIYLLGPASDDVWIHDPDDFNNPVQEDALDDIRTTSGEAGVLSRDGTILWLSGDATTPVRAYNVNTDTWSNFGTTDDMKCLAGTDTYVILHNAANGKLERYDPTFGGSPSLNSVTRQWTTTVFSGNSAWGVWDGDDNLWFAVNGNLIEIDPDAAEINTHAYPAAWTVSFTPVFDSLRNRLYCGSPTGTTDIYMYSGWNTAVNDSGNWNVFIEDTEAQVLYFDPVSDVLAIAEPGLAVVHRFLALTGQKIDTVSMDDNTPDNPQVDYDMRGGSPATLVYKDNALYIIGDKAGAEYMVRINYAGDPIPGFGAGAGAVASVLVPLYEVTSATQATIYLFRSLSPPIYADGEFTVEFFYPD